MSLPKYNIMTINTILWWNKLLKKKQKIEYANYLTLVMLFFVGGFLFHLIWETKSQYVWTYVEILIPISAMEFNHLFAYANRWRKKL